ncbi:MAG: hypothetical protein AB1730_19380 [Myxococcota bacterium]
MSAALPVVPRASAGRAADVQVLSASASVEVSELTTGTLLMRVARDGVAARGPFATVSLRVDHTFVSVSLPLLLGVDALKATLQEALPDGYVPLLSHGGDAIILTVLRTVTHRQPDVFCTSRDARQRVRRTGPNRFTLRGNARGHSRLVLRVDGQAWRLALEAGERPLDVAERLRAALQPRWTALLDASTEPGGPVSVTVLPRR